MRHFTQRFVALAIALAMVFGLASAASAQQVTTETEEGSIAVVANVTGYLNLTASTQTINFGRVDAFGLRPASYYNRSTLCEAATTDAGGARYGANESLTLTIVSSTDYTLSVQNVSGDTDNFLVLEGSSACSANQSIDQITGYTATGDATFAGDSRTYSFGVRVFSSDGNLNASVNYVFTAEAV